MMKTVILTAAMAALGLAMFAGTPASARGGASNLLNSPGYQRALEESRKQQVAQPYTQPPAVYPRKKWRHRGRH